MSQPNPFGSPALPETASQPSGNVPSPLMLFAGVLAGIPLASASSYDIYLDPEFTSNDKMLWAIADIVTGVGMGLGIAFLWQAIAAKKFSTLAPGHWGLIALILGVAVVIMEAVPEFLSAVFYVAMVLCSKESRLWKGYGWTMAVSYLVTGVIVAISQFIADDIALMMESMLEGEGRPTGNATVGLFYGVSLIGNLADLIVLGLMIGGVITDVSNKVKRDMFHYIGLVLVMTLPMVYGVVSIIIFAMAEY